MQRIVEELYDVVLSGVVVDGVPGDEGSSDFDLEREVTVRCENGTLVKGARLGRRCDGVGILR